VTIGNVFAREKAKREKGKEEKTREV